MTYCEIHEMDNCAHEERKVRVVQRRTVGEQLRDEGMAVVGKGNPDADAWTEKAVVALEELISTGRPFTSDDIHLKVGDPPVKNLMGSLMGKAYGLGANEIGYVKTKRDKGHARRIILWGSS
jgi:hypothetical protein